MGTPRFAVPSLNALAQSRHQLIAVVTNPTDPKDGAASLQVHPSKNKH